MITETRKRELEQMNAKNGWGFTKDQLLIFLSVFCECEEILYRLEDCNFHTFCRLLSNLELQEAKDWIEKNM